MKFRIYQPFSGPLCSIASLLLICRLAQRKGIMHKKQYLLDNEPASAFDLITLASSLDRNFGSDGLKCSSEAANILRRNGHTVTVRQLNTVEETDN